MNHNYVRDERFNILTARRDKGFLIFSGETKDPIEVGDVINYPFGGFNAVCEVSKIIERRDAKAYPKGNGMYYVCECSSKVLTRDEIVEMSKLMPMGIPMEEPPKEPKDGKRI